MPNTLSDWLWFIFITLPLAFVINLISEYAKPKIDSVWGMYSIKQKKKNELEQAEVASYVEDMDSIPEVVVNTYHLHTYYAIQNGVYSILSFVLITSYMQIMPIEKLNNLLNNVKSIHEFYNRAISNPQVIVELLVFFLLYLIAIVFMIRQSRTNKKLRFFTKVINDYTYLVAKKINTNRK